MPMPLPFIFPQKDKNQNEKKITIKIKQWSIAKQAMLILPSIPACEKSGL